jgi:hypothetical protein
LFTFDPNILAHGRLVTPDLGQTALIFLAAWMWTEYLRQPDLLRWLGSSLLLGLALAAGFPAALLLLVCAVGAGVQGWRRLGGRGAVRTLAVWFGCVALSGLVVWSIYGFDWGLVSGLSFPVPAPYYWEEFLDLLLTLPARSIGAAGRSSLWLSCF